MITHLTRISQRLDNNSFALDKNNKNEVCNHACDLYLQFHWDLAMLRERENNKSIENMLNDNV